MRRTLGLNAGLSVVALMMFVVASPADNERFLMYEDFTDGFLGAALPPGWVVEDANGDLLQWAAVEWGGVRGGPSARFPGSTAGAADDWLISAPIDLEAGNEYKLTFHANVMDAGRPQSLDIVVGAAPTTGTMVGSLSDLVDLDPTLQTVTFEADASGPQQVQFRATSPEDSLALYLSRVILAEPEGNLRVELELDATFYNPDDPAVFANGEEIRCLVRVRNTGGETMTVNKRLNVNDEAVPDSALAFRITGPGGETIMFGGRIREAKPFESDFVELATDATVFKYYDLNVGVFDLSATGDYTVRAVYKNTHLPQSGTAWRGVLVSDPVTFTIE